MCVFNFSWDYGRLLIHLSGKGQKSAFLRVLASLWLQSLYLKDLTPLNLFAEGLSKEPRSLFYILPPYLHVLCLTWC